jgi:hypothetical protein
MYATFVPSRAICSLEDAESAEEGKHPMKKSFRVGTVLTGAAACAAAFAPTAAAATTTATAGKPLPGNTTEVDCTAADAHWFHLYWSPALDHGPTCVHIPGTKTVDHWFDAFCAGADYGWFTYISLYGLSHKQGFSPHGGEIVIGSYSSSFYVKSLHISESGAGNFTCPS